MPVYTFKPTEVKINSESLIGIVEEVTLTLNRKFQEINTQGMTFPADIPIPGKFEKPEVKIKFKGAPPVSIMRKALSPNFFVKLSFTSKIYGISEMQGLVHDEDFTVRVNGWLKGVGDIASKEEGYEQEIGIAPAYIEIKGTKSGKLTAIGVEGILQDELNLLAQSPGGF